MQQRLGLGHEKHVVGQVSNSPITVVGHRDNDAVSGLNLLYLAGGIVLVETVFNYPGVGLALVGAIAARDIPVIQSLVVMLAIAYILINITADVAVLLVTPRRRYPRA